jgi:hypothetical protein
MACSRPLAMCAVMFALGGCASDPDFLSERTLQQANAIDTPPAAMKAKTVSYREDIPAPAPPIALPSRKVVAAVKPEQLRALQCHHEPFRKSEPVGLWCEGGAGSRLEGCGLIRVGCRCLTKRSDHELPRC